MVKACIVRLVRPSCFRPIFSCRPDLTLTLLLPRCRIARIALLLLLCSNLLNPNLLSRTHMIPSLRRKGRFFPHMYVRWRRSFCFFKVLLLLIDNNNRNYTTSPFHNNLIWITLLRLFVIINFWNLYIIKYKRLKTHCLITIKEPTAKSFSDLNQVENSTAVDLIAWSNQIGWGISCLRSRPKPENPKLHSLY